MDWASIGTALGSVFIGDRLSKRDFSRQAGHSEYQAQKQMDFQERMSNTAYQRAMADMRQAGLNPILAAKLGGASTPSGSMASTPKIDTPSSIKNVIAVRTAQAQIEQLDSQTRLANAKAMVEEQKGASDYGTHTTNKVLSDIRNIEQNTMLLQAKRENWKIKNTLDLWESNWYRNVYKAPKATLVAKPLNYIMSSAMSGLPEHERSRLLNNVHKGIKMMNDNIEYILKNPEALIGAVGATATGIIMKSIVQSINLNKKGKRNAKKR